MLSVKMVGRGSPVPRERPIGAENDSQVKK